MSSLSSIVSSDGSIRRGLSGPDVLALQIALSQAGYRVGQDSQFGPRTEMVVQQFQRQHSLPSDGVVGLHTATLLDLPHSAVVSAAQPLVAASGWPHDDTASLIDFYGNPDASDFSYQLAPVDVPFDMTYREDDGSLLPIKHISFHKKAGPALTATLKRIAEIGTPEILKHISHFSGSYNNRSIRGSSRKSCHAFGVAVDFDAEHLPLGHGIAAAEMPQDVVSAFKANGAFWGGDYTGRKDPMHFQWAHE